MEALCNLQEKWNLSTQEALLIFVCSAFAVIGLCTTAILKKKKKNNRISGKQFTEKESGSIDVNTMNWTESKSGWGSMKKALVSSVRWSEPNKWEEKESRNWRQTTAPTLLLTEGGNGETMESSRWSHNSASQVWQRPILMGEKCELPKFSGLILYDGQGRSLCGSNREMVQQEKITAPVVTTLRDLLGSESDSDCLFLL